MNPIDYAIGYIRRYVEPEILSMAFKSENKFTSIDDLIKYNVIIDIVMQDINLIGGERVEIFLRDTNVIEERRDGIILEVPLSLTNNRPILNVLNIYDATYTEKGIGFEAEHTRNMFATTKYKILGKNLIFIKDLITPVYNYVMRCNIVYDINFSELKPENMSFFGELCLQACKKYIHNELNLKLNKGSIYYGHELSYVRNIVDNYESSEEEYKRLRDEGDLHVRLFTNDDQRMDEYINLLLPDRF